jgi:hypothetical protein
MASISRKSSYKVPMIIFRCYIMGDEPIIIEQFSYGFEGVIMGSIMGSQNIMGSSASQFRLGACVINRPRRGWGIFGWKRSPVAGRQCQGLRILRISAWIGDLNGNSPQLQVVSAEVYQSPIAWLKLDVWTTLKRFWQVGLRVSSTDRFADYNCFFFLQFPAVNEKASISARNGLRKKKTDCETCYSTIFSPDYQLLCKWASIIIIRYYFLRPRRPEGVPRIV